MSSIPSVSLCTRYTTPSKINPLNQLLLVSLGGEGRKPFVFRS